MKMYINLQKGDFLELDSVDLFFSLSRFIKIMWRVWIYIYIYIYIYIVVVFYIYLCFCDTDENQFIPK